MKIRIKGNAIRFRLTKPDVEKLEDSGYLEETTSFGENKFMYALHAVETETDISASLDQNKITMLVPRQLIKGWGANDVVGFNAAMYISDKESLFLLLEKDFVCLDETTEDQSDHYENPNKNINA